MEHNHLNKAINYSPSIGKTRLTYICAHLRLNDGEVRQQEQERHVSGVTGLTGLTELTGVMGLTRVTGVKRLSNKGRG